MKKAVIVALAAVSLVGVSITSISAQSQTDIPSWVKNNAVWWGKGQISDSEFLSALQFLINNNFLKVESSDSRDINALEDKVKKLENENRNLKNYVVDLENENKKLRLSIDNTNTKPKQSTPSPQKCSSSAKCISETITQVVDGDTIYTTNYKIRLSLTNTPEKNQSGFSDQTVLSY